MTHDDLLIDGELQFPLNIFIQEKIDGPILGNREHILKKGYDARTPAKKQFVPAWNWLHAHEKDIKTIIDEVGQVTIYGEWMLAEHSLSYDKLADYFMAYDIWSVDDQKFLNPKVVRNLLSATNISFIEPKEVIVESMEQLIELSEMDSMFRDGKAEGIVGKIADDKFIKMMFKMVNKYFVRTDEFNDRDIIKNTINGL